MGATCSTRKDEVTDYLTQEELEDLKIGSCFTRPEIQRLYNRFRAVDDDDDKTLSLEEFMNFPEFRLNPLAYRLKEILDPNGSGSITFKRFVNIMSAFSPSAPDSRKFELAFQLYDADHDGKISKEDLTSTLKLTTYIGDKGKDNEFNEDDLVDVVDKTFEEVVPGLDHIDQDAFNKVVSAPGFDLLSRMTMQF